MRASARHIEAGGIGYNNGYTTLEAFISNDPNRWCATPFLDVRAHLFNDGKFAVNAGLGARSLWGCRAYGMNFYYDYRYTHRREYNQIGVGLETLGVLWDLRINGYLPIGGKVSHPYQIEFGGFSGNSILVNRKFQYAMKGIDGEVGFHFGKTSDFDFYGAIGPYYFKGKVGPGAIGGKGRIAGTYKEYVALELSDSWDNVFKNNVQGQVTLTLSFGPSSRAQMDKKSCIDTCSLAMTLTERMLQPVTRQEILVVSDHTKSDPTSDFVLFVDNMSHSAGTFESPYATLADAEAASSPGDIIYVFPGDGTTTGMSNGITLLNNQSLWGSGVPHSLTTNFGNILIPSQTATSPQITNTAGDGITLASDNNVSGFIITRAQGDGVIGLDIDNAVLSELTIFGSLNHGLLFMESDDAMLTLDQLFVTNNTLDGISFITSSDADVDLFITNSTFSVNGNTSPNGRGIVLNPTGTSTFNAVFTGNTFASNLLSAISLESTSNASSPLTFSFTDNLIEGNADRAITGSFTGTAPIDVILTNNQIIGNYGDATLGEGVSYFSFGGTGASTLSATGNQFNRNTEAGALYIVAGASGAFTGNISNNLMSENCGVGVNFFCAGTNSISLTFENNTIFGNGGDGMDIIATAANAPFVFVANNNSFDANSGYGLQISDSGGSFQTLSTSFTGNTFNGNGAYGLSVTSPITQNFTGEFTDNTADANSDDGFIFGSSVTQNFTVEFTGNTFIGNNGNGINCSPSVGNDFVFEATSNQFLGQCGNGIFIDNTAVESTIEITGNTIQDNDGDGVLITVEPTGIETVSATFTNNIISYQTQNGGNGITFDYAGTSTATSTFIAEGNTLTNNDGDGLQISLTTSGGGGTLNLTINDNTASFNRGNGFNVIGDSDATLFELNGTFESNTASNNNLSGLTFLSESNTEAVLIAIDNTFANNNPFLATPNYAGFQATNAAPFSSICATLTSNTSDTGYLLTGYLLTASEVGFVLPQTLSEVEAANTGTITAVGAVDFDTPCP